MSRTHKVEKWETIDWEGIAFWIFALAITAYLYLEIGSWVAGFFRNVPGL